MSKALIVVDMQNDFVDPAGALYVKGAETLIQPMNAMIRLFDHVILTMDWHPLNHISFHERNGPFPRHCVSGTWGAKMHPALNLSQIQAVVMKGRSLYADELSGFGQIHDISILRSILYELTPSEVHIVGVAYDYCVRATAIDAAFVGRDLHYKTLVRKHLTLPVNPLDVSKVDRELTQSGVELL